MTTAQDVAQVQTDAARHVLTAIQSLEVKNSAHSAMMLELAEVFAWLRYPNQGHGGPAK